MHNDLGQIQHSDELWFASIIAADTYLLSSKTVHYRLLLPVRLAARNPVLCHPTDGCDLGSVLAWGTGRVNSAVTLRLGPEVSSSVDFNILSVAQGCRVGNKDRRQSTHI